MKALCGWAVASYSPMSRDITLPSRAFFCCVLQVAFVWRRLKVPLLWADSALGRVQRSNWQHYREIFSILARVSWDVRTRSHYAGEVQWIKKQRTQHHPYGWEVRVRVRLAGGAREIVVVVSTKGGGKLHVGGLVGPPGVVGRIRSMMYGSHARVGGRGLHTILPFAIRATFEASDQRAMRPSTTFAMVSSPPPIGAG